LKLPETVNLDLDADVLLISGSAPHAWILKMRDAIKSMPWISRYDDSHLEDLDLMNFEALREKIEQRYFLFEYDSADMIEGQEPEFQAFIDDLKNFLKIAKELEKAVRIEIVGHADSRGTESGNLIVSQDRAKKILAILLNEGLDAKGFKTSGLGSREPWKEEITDQDRELNRRVTIRVVE
jgi:OOP family OmpA-OmpF porin